MTPTAHKNTHKKNGTDPIAPADIGAAPESHTHDGRYYTEDEIDAELAKKVPLSSIQVNGGDSASANGVNSIAVGAASAGGNSAIALGHNANASGICSTVLGHNAKANGNYAVALGHGTDASNHASVALGSGSNASGDSAVALGRDTKATGSYTTALGSFANASGIYASILGYLANASGYGSVALGCEANASGDTAMALGRHTNVSGNYSTAIGYRAATANTNSIQLGDASYLSSITSKVAITVTLDERDKTDISPVESKAVDFLRKVQAIRYAWNGRSMYIPEEESRSETDNENLSKFGLCEYDREAHAKGSKKGSRVRVSVSAQNVQKALAEVYGDSSYANLVNDNFFDFDPDEIPEGVENQLAVNYEGFIPFLIQAVRELHERIEVLEKREVS